MIFIIEFKILRGYFWVMINSKQYIEDMSKSEIIFFCPKCKNALRQVTCRDHDGIEEDYKCDKCIDYYRPNWDNLFPDLDELLHPDEYIFFT